ncbi:MAG: hypothetical protein Fur0046_37560 [Cyanobacteria bacterium J069]|nr:MAG: hypothetical protein D6742_06200 [Cyanobacteria bacterium J069]
MTTISIIGFILIILVLGALINTLATGAVRLIAFAVLGVIATLLLSNTVRNPSASISLPRIPNIFRTSQQPEVVQPPAAVGGGEATTPAGQTPTQQAPAAAGGGEATYSTDSGSNISPDPASYQAPPAQSAAPAQTPVRGLW